MESDDDDINSVINLFNSYKDKLIISTLPQKYIDYTEHVKNFFEKMVIIGRDSIDFNEIVNDVSKLNDEEREKFSKILQSADISIKDIKLYDQIDDSSKQLRLFSEYMMNNKPASMPSIITDSDGTKTFMLYMLKIIEIMRKGGLLVIDEIDNSLHTLLTKNIISIFNDENNKNMQLLATSHDLLLLDCLYLFRKDQVWFTYKDDAKVYLYSSIFG
jgi:AAA15 family ATPase/GTPase